MRIKIENFPFPISVNASYITVLRGNKFLRTKSKALEEYQNECEQYRLCNSKNFGRVRDAIKNFESLKIEIKLYFKRERIFTKKNELKKIDVANFEKPLCDELSKCINIDDRYFNFVSLEKKLSEKNSDYVIVTIEPHQINSA